MNARDALEVVRLLAGGGGDLDHAHTSGKVPEAIAVLTALVERAGELVAVVIPNAVGVELAWLNPPSEGRPPVGTKLYAAPGASHER